MMIKRKSRLCLAITAFLTLVLSIFALVQGALMYSTANDKILYSKVWAKDKTQEIAAGLSDKIDKVSKIADQLASEINQYECHPCNIEPLLKSAYLRHTDFESIGAAYDASQSGTQYRLYAPFIRRNSPNVTIERLDQYYDYQAVQTGSKNLIHDPEAWYGYAKKNSNSWSDPFFERALNKHIIRYTSPILNQQDKQIGLVFIDISIDWLNEKLETFDLRDNNYLRLRIKQGPDLHHSLKGIRRVLTGLKSEEKMESIGINRLTGERAWINRTLVQNTNWELETTISKKSIDKLHLLEAQDEKTFLPVIITESNPVAWVTLLVLICLLGYTCYRLSRRRTSTQQLWWDSAVYTFLMSLSIVAVWILDFGSITDRPENSIILANKAIIEQYQSDYAVQSLQSYDKTPTFIPVGLFIQSIEFLSASNVNITGYIWHRYREGQKSDYEVGTVFPEAINTNIKSAYEDTQNGETLKGWYFETTLRENFSPALFPFDRQSVWIRLWHENIGDNIILVPDAQSYDSLNTQSLPGIEKDFVLSGWSLYRSYFEMRRNSYNTKLGRINSSSTTAVPELYFNIEVTRNFINPFLAHLFPLLVVVLMLYAIIVTMSKNDDRKDILGFNAAGVIASCSALFFVALIAHVQMRTELAANSVVYLEYFYLVTYVAILVVTANAVILSLNVNVRLVQYHDNLLPKLLYWPALTACLLLCTLWTFR